MGILPFREYLLYFVKTFAYSWEKGELHSAIGEELPMNFKSFKLVYLAFCMPFVLAYVSWRFFPIFAQWLILDVLGYTVVARATSDLWYQFVAFFYGWYTFLAIGIAGFWAVAANHARKQHLKTESPHRPMVSFVVPAYNEEKKVSRCISSLFRCAEKYKEPCEIIVVDDGSSDYTYEVAWSSIELNRRKYPKVHGKVVRHSVNLGKVEAIRTGMNKALGSVIAVVDADSWWLPETLVKLVDYMFSNGKKAVTGYVHPSDGVDELSPYVILQQLEYSQGLGVGRCAQSLGNNVLVVSGAIGLFDANALRQILSEKNVHSVTEDLEITLEMHKRGAEVGYVSAAASSTAVPESFNILWSQRLRWFTGWLYNTLGIHRQLLLKKSWLPRLLWYCYIFEYGGALIDLTALTTFPFLFWFAPDRILFIINFMIFATYGLIIGALSQAIALKYAYNKHNYKSLLFYTPYYPILRLINIFARLTSSVRYLLGDHGSWHKNLKP